MTVIVYAITAAGLLALTHRSVRAMSRVAALLLFLFPFCFTGDALVRGRAYGPFDLAYITEPLSTMRDEYGIRSQINGGLSDVATQMIPWRQAVRWSITHHEWPIWNPFIMCGDILASAAQPAAYSPFTLIALLLPIGHSFTFTATITFFLAALSAFLFARDLGCREVSALIGAAGWMCSAGLTFFVEWPLGYSWTLLPLVLLGVRRVVVDPSMRSTALLTTAFTLLLLGGHPETAVHVVYLAAAYAAFEVAKKRAQFGSVVIAAFSAGLIALALSAVFILPFIEAVTQTSQRVSRQLFFKYERRGVPSPQVLARLAADAFPFLYARRWTIASVRDTPPETAAVGSIVLAFAVFAVRRRASREVWFFAAVAIIGLLIRADWPPVVRTLQKLPLLDVTLNERYSFAAAYALTLLAAIGVESMLQEPASRSAAVTIAIVLIVLGAGTFALLRAGVVMPNAERWGDYKIAAELCGLSFVAALLIAPIPTQWRVALILGAVLLQRAVSDRGLYTSFPQSSVYPRVPVFEPLRNIREPFRTTGFFISMVAGTGAMYNLEDPRGYEAMTFDRMHTTYPLWCEGEPVWFNRTNDLTKPFLSFLNIRFAVVPATFEAPAGWREFASQRGCKVIENMNVIPRAFVPSRVRIGVDQSDAMRDMYTATDFRNVAWIESPRPMQELENGPGSIAIRRRGTVYKLTADMQREGWIVVSESAWHGWRADIDGHDAPVRYANIAFLAVHVPQGHHRVTLRYKPQSFVTGRIISLTTLALLVLGAAAASRRTARVALTALRARRLRR